jgi:hypothetical protein
VTNPRAHAPISQSESIYALPSEKRTQERDSYRGSRHREIRPRRSVGLAGFCRSDENSGAVVPPRATRSPARVRGGFPRIRSPTPWTGDEHRHGSTMAVMERSDGGDLVTGLAQGGWVKDGGSRGGAPGYGLARTGPGLLYDAGEVRGRSAARRSRGGRCGEDFASSVARERDDNVAPPVGARRRRASWAAR